MDSLSFENRVSLTRKSEDLNNAVEELSSSYAKRESIATINSRPTRTSEICTAIAYCYMFTIAVAAFAGAIVIYGEVGVCSWGLDCGGGYAMVDSALYKNIV